MYRILRHNKIHKQRFPKSLWLINGRGVLQWCSDWRGRLLNSLVFTIWKTMPSRKYLSVACLSNNSTILTILNWYFLLFSDPSSMFLVQRFLQEINILGPKSFLYCSTFYDIELHFDGSIIMIFFSFNGG